MPRHPNKGSLLLKKTLVIKKRSSGKETGVWSTNCEQTVSSSSTHRRREVVRFTFYFYISKTSLHITHFLTRRYTICYKRIVPIESCSMSYSMSCSMLMLSSGLSEVSLIIFIWLYHSLYLSSFVLKLHWFSQLFFSSGTECWWSSRICHDLVIAEHV